MMNGVDINQVKQYNEQLKKYKEQAAKIKVEIEMNTSELNRLCEELTAELGVQVNPDNIEQIYNDRVEKVRNTLQSGTEIMDRIRQESMM